MRALLAAAALVALVAGAACAGDDDELSALGMATPHAIELAIEVRADGIREAGGGGGGGGDGAPVLRIPAHTDLTLVVRNADAVPHTLVLYADEAGEAKAAESGEVEPGGETAMRYHFHDAQRVLLADAADRDRIRAWIEVGG